MKKGPLLIEAYRWTKLPLIVVPVIFGTVLYGIGLLLALLSSNIPDYLSQWYVPPIIIGIIWVSTVFCWASTRYERILDRVMPALGLPTEFRHAVVRRHLESVYNDRKALLAAFPFAFSFLAATIAIRVGALPVSSATFQEFGMTYFFAFLMVIVALAGYHAGFGAYLFMIHIRFVNQIARESKPDLMRTETSEALDGLSRFSWMSSLGWFGGVGILSAVVARYETTVSFFFLGAVIVLGVVWFLLPQLGVRKAILRSKGDLLKSLHQDMENVAQKGANNIEMNKLEAREKIIGGIRDWPFAPRTLNLELVSMLVTVVFFLLGFFHVSG